MQTQQPGIGTQGANSLTTVMRP